MEKNVYDLLMARGFIEQVTEAEPLRQALAGRVTCYAGFDPTADSMHVGHLLPIMALAHMQRAGHRPIVIMGGGTAMIGDPSGKSEMRRILSTREIADNSAKIKEQFSRYIDFDRDDSALLLNNAEWLVSLRYIDFLRDIGKHFSVNRMLAAEAYRSRLEAGLNFIEFNYMLLQAYDFLALYQRQGCTLQLGGNDQWGNIIAGVDLIRRIEGATAYGMTFPLITTASGAKMGKTEKGAVWLDPHKTSAYEYYQFWINTDDRDALRFLRLFTFLAAEELETLARDTAQNMPAVKQRLAYEATSVTHGSAEAAKAQEAARAVFYNEGANSESLPTTSISLQRLREGIPAFKLFEEAGLCATRSEARRLIQEGGAYINGERLQEFDARIDDQRLRDGGILLRAGKKRYHRIVPE